MTEKRIERILLAVACLVPFMRLGMGEIQPWDESLYAIRADACLKFGAWLDQTRYAVGNLYSGTHPPLGVWLIAISKYMFGNSTFATRFPLALAASASIYVLWLLLRKFVSNGAALVAVVSVAASDLFLTASHRAQMESLILFFGISSIYCFVLALERNQLRFSVLSGILLGFGLLTKFGFSLYIVPILFLLPWAMERKNTYWYPTLALLVGIAVAAPWFMLMSIWHPDYWPHVTGSLTTLAEGHYAPSRLAWWYYINRLFVAMPLLVAGFFVRNRNRTFIASLIWLLVLLIGLELGGTRMPHFAIVLLPPAAFLVAASWDAAWELRGSRTIWLIILVLIAVGWSANEQIRLILTGRWTWNEFYISGTSAIVLLVAFALVVFFWFQKRYEHRMTLAFSLMLLGIGFSQLFWEPESTSIDGARQTAAIMLSQPSKTTLIVIHPNFPTEQYAPQLAYYTHGWTLGWFPDKHSRTFTWDSASMTYTPDSSQEMAVVIRFENQFYRRPQSEILLWNALMAKLRRSYSHESDLRSYFLFY